MCQLHRRTFVSYSLRQAKRNNKTNLNTWSIEKNFKQTGDTADQRFRQRREVRVVSCIIHT